MNNYKDKVKELADRKRVRLLDVCNATGINPTHLSRLNQKEPLFITMVRLADYFNVPLDYFADRGQVAIADNNSQAINVKGANNYVSGNELDQGIKKFIRKLNTLEKAELYIYLNGKYGEKVNDR